MLFSTAILIILVLFSKVESMHKHKTKQIVSMNTKYDHIGTIGHTLQLTQNVARNSTVLKNHNQSNYQITKAVKEETPINYKCVIKMAVCIFRIPVTQKNQVVKPN